MSVKQGGKTIAGATRYHPDLFDFKWADHILNDAQWLMADTFSWQYGSMYKVAYAHLATDIDGKTLQSETIFDITIQFYLADDGHKICPASEEDKILSLYNKIGVAWYYIIDTANQRFKLPRESEGNKYHGKIIKTYNDGNKWARLYNDGWVEQGGRTNDGNFLITMANTNYSAIVSPLTMYAGERSVGNIIYRNSVNDVTFGWGNTSSGDLSWEVKGWSVYANNDQYFDGKKYLYFYVGAFTQTALENTAGLNTELFNGKADLNLANVLASIDFVVEKQEPTAENNYTWYRKYRSGWVEQGGIYTFSSSSPHTITLPQQMSSTNYDINISAGYPGAGDNTVSIHIRTDMITTTSFAIQKHWTSNNGAYYWQVSGMAA